MHEYIRVVRDSKIPGMIQAGLFLRTKLKFTERRTQCEHEQLSCWRTRVTVSTGIHARRATGLTVTEREENLTRTESVARWSRKGRAAYEADRETLLFVFFFLTGARCSNQAEKYYMRGDGEFFFSSRIFRF